MSLIKKITLGRGASAVEYDIGALAENVPYDDENSIKTEMNGHIREAGASEEGSHGIRYLKDHENLQVWDDEREIWVNVAKGNIEDIYIGDVIGATILSEGTTVHIIWTDPEDVIYGGEPVAEWAGTKLVRKRGSAPENVEDGTVIVDNKVRNQYSSNGFVDSGLEQDVVYYYRFFPYIIKGVDERYTPGYSIKVKASQGVVSKVPSPASALIYNNAVQSPQWNDYDTNKLSIGGEDSAKPVGVYTVSFTPLPGYSWSDGNSDPKYVNWYIIADGIAVPTVTNTSLTYNGTIQGPTISAFDTDIINIVGNTAQNAGQYKVIFSFKNPSAYIWKTFNDSTPKETPWKIEPQTVGIPTLSGDYYYTGRSQSVTISAHDSNIVKSEGSMSGINAGTYVITFRLANTNNYKWIDNTTDQKPMSWEIKKAACTVTLTYNGEPVTSESDIPLNPESPTSISITKPNGSGTISATSSAPTIAAVSINNDNELIITTSGTVNGTANITVNVAESSNYNSYSITFKATSFKNGLVAWGVGTDAQIQNIINRYYNGELTLEQIQEVWVLGDTRIVHVNSFLDPLMDGSSHTHRSQDLKMRIIDFNHDELTTPINGKTKALISLQTTVCFTDETRGENYGDNNTWGMSDTERVYFGISNIGGWKDCQPRVILNNAFYNALPNTFKSWVKQVKKINAVGGGTAQLGETTNDYIWLPSEYECAGTTTYAKVQEGTQYAYYRQAVNNRAIFPTWRPRTSFPDHLSQIYWLRSPAVVPDSSSTEWDESTISWCCIHYDLSVDTGYAGEQINSVLGLAPACCI